jgi:D-ribose pyranase
MPAPSDCNYIDLGLIRGIPSFWDVLKAVLREIVVEEYAVFDLMPQYNPEMHKKIQKMMSNIPGKTMTQQEMAALMRSAKAVIRTAEFGSSCNIVLYAASGMDKYVEKFNIDPTDD